MNSTLNKSIRALVSLLLAVCMCLSLASCTRNTRDIKNIDQICVSGALCESWMNVFTDEEFVDEMVEIFNGIKYEKSQEAVNMMDPKQVICLSFSNGNDTRAKLIVDNNNLMCFEAGSQSYRIVSDFDFDYVMSLVEEQKAAADESVATDDEV